MCEYVEINKCQITKAVCPFVYWCDKTQKWIGNKYMPTNCKIKQNNVVKHKGKYKVVQCRNKYLYIDINGTIYKLLNPFDFVPDYVDIQKKNGEYIIKNFQ